MKFQAFDKTLEQLNYVYVIGLYNEGGGDRKSV